MRIAALTAAVLLATVINGMADARKYAWTYEYKTMQEGMTELEYYLTLKVPDTSESKISTWQHQAELEYGITPRWDIAMYQVWEEKITAESSEFDYTGFKLRTRYRIKERDELPVDILLYGEYERESDLTEADIGELKLVLSKKLGSFDISYNQILEQTLSGDDKAEHKYALGTGYELPSELHLGVEASGNYSEGEHSLGPTIAFKGEGCFMVLGALFGLDQDADDIQARVIIGKVL